jgi:negative regulator of sigma E activity
MSKRKTNQQKLKTAQVEQISAYLDGELLAEDSARTAERIKRDATWGRTARSFEMVDSTLEAWQPALLRRDLTGSILAAAHRRPARPAWLRVAAPLAAAAAVLLIVMLYQVVNPPAGAQRNGVMAGGNGAAARVVEDAVLAQVPEEDRFVVANLDVIENMDVLANFETLEAMDRLAARKNGDL